MLWQKLKEKEPDKRIASSHSTKRQIAGFDVVRLREQLSVTLMACLVEACSMLSEEVILCKCESCSDMVRRVLVRQMTFIHFFDTSSSPMKGRDIEVIIKDGPFALSICGWKTNQMQYAELLMKDPLGSDVICEHASQFPGRIHTLTTFLYSVKK